GDLKGARQQQALAEIQAEHDNIRLAWNWAAEQGQVEQLSQAMDGLGFFYDWRGRYPEGESAFQIAAEKVLPSYQTLLLLAKLSTWQALFCRRRGQMVQAHQLLQKSLSYLNQPELEGQNLGSQQTFVLFEMGSFMSEKDPPAAQAWF